jgi:hypothetical protein
VKTGLRIVVLGLVSLLLSPAVAWARVGGAPVAIVLRPVEDVSFPFWCDWSYDWEARCWWEDGDRLPVGGDEDKVWRAGLRFSLASVPRGSTILDASLTLRHDAVCLGPRKIIAPCPPRRYGFDLHAIATERWFSEREVEIWPAVSRAVLPLATRPEWLTWDVTELVAGWAAGEPNNGVLLKLVDTEEDYGVGGPAFPASSFATAAARPALDVAYLPPG